MDFSSLLNDILNFLRAGFADVNSQILGIIIALVAAYAMSAWGRLWIVALGPMFAHLAIRDLILPLIQNQGFHLPTNLMDKSYWIGDGGALNLLAGYVIVIAVFYFLKKHLLGRVAHAH